MNKRKVSLEDFYKWYSLNKEELLNKATVGEKFNDKLKEEFLQEWPLDRILTMSIDEYVIGKGQQNKSLCYALEKGKYKNLFLGISGGSASKFGIYWNKKTNKYKDQANNEISELDQRFSKLKSDLYEIIKEGIRFNFENPIFDMKRSTNEFIGRSAMVTKLLCIYSEGDPFFGVNINSQKAKETQLIGGQDNFDEAWDSYLEYINVAEEKEYITKTSYLSVNSRQNLSVNYDSGVPGWSLPSKYVYELYKDKNYNKQEYYKSGGKTVLETLRKRFGLKDYVSPTEIDTDKKFVFIIDEINRGEISKIFGELFFSIGPGYRGEKGSVSTQYANLHETDEKFYIPENVYIIGTMNDIDRSVDTFDFAMRRRFRFVEVTAEGQVGMLDKELNIHAEEAKIRLRNLNAAIENVQELNSHYHIGPSYFLKLKDVDFDYELLWSDYIKPLLEDYLRGSYDEVETLETLKKAFELTNNEQKDQAVADDNEGDENDDADY
ncbi:McrB family protein [Streptococcus pneumoniae]|nr:McrB family protein [Streptococcus pneumoniae]